MKTLLFLVVLCGLATSQQPNTASAGQLCFTQTSGLIGLPWGVPGPYLLQVTAPVGNVALQVQGWTQSYFESWVASGPPALGAALLVGGIVDLDLSRLWQYPVFWGVTPSATGYAASAISFSYNLTTALDLTVQSWIMDPASAVGWRLTGACHVVQ